MISNSDLAPAKPLVYVDAAWEPARISMGTMLRRARRPDILGVVGWVCRLGVRTFFRQLELEYFPPVGPVNDDYQLVQTRFPDNDCTPTGMWFTILIPRRFEPLAREVAHLNSLRLADGIPTIIEMEKGQNKRTHTFPTFTGSNIYTLENVVGSAVYANDPKANSQVDDLESLMLSTVENDFRVKYADYFAQRAARKARNN